MGNYNPHAPYIIGEEWVPIRQANYLPDDGVTERGYSFHIDHGATIVSGAYYVAVPPPSPSSSTVEFMSVYPAGTEDLTGPIKSLVIPASAANVTGSGITTSGVSDLLNPSDGNFVVFEGGPTSTGSLGISFDVTSYSQQLFGKRILDVRLRYTASGTVDGLAAFTVWLRRLLTANSLGYQTGLEGATASDPQNQVNTISFSDINPFWTSAGAVDGSLQQIVYPWRYQELANFSTTAAAADRMIVYVVPGLFNLTTSDDVLMGYAALEVIYCEEQRILYGGDRMNFSTGGNFYPATPAGKFVMLKTPAFAAPTAIAAGEYTVVENHRKIFPDTTTVAPTLFALRELYQLPHQRGLQINRSLVLDETFTVDELNTLTHLTLHTASAIVTGVHAYGTQDDVPVYGTITAIQEIEDDPVGTAKSFPQVRFYARRFGDTQVPLTLVDVATGLSTVSISVAEFDALTEIVDGWREVNLRFATAPSFSTAAGDVDWRWQATGEIAGNQWQVLGAGGPAMAGAHANGVPSYYSPQGNTVTLTWQSPVISGAAEDTTSDAVLIFSTDTPTVSGFVLETLSQEITGITSNCIVPPRCIPTGIDYHQLTWTLPAGIACDAFERTQVASIGVADTGQTWALNSTAAQFNVTNGFATIQPDTNSADRFAIVTTNSADNSVLVDMKASALPASGSLMMGAMIRYVDANNYYFARGIYTTAGAFSAVFGKRVAGVLSSIATVTLPFVFVPNISYTLRAQVVGSTMAMRIWPSHQDEPGFWNLTAVDTSITTGTGIGLYARNDSAVATQVFSFDNFSAVPFQLLDGRYEIQRMDDLDEDWQTILDTTDLCTTHYNDFEARVGVLTEYRIRLCNVLDFCGPTWATTSGTITAPGITVSGDGNSVLIFTSNENPDVNLAYIMQFEGQAIETFAFPEVGEIQLQRMYGKDFFTAFHPLERGGEQFTRNILVNAAAIPAPSLANFRSLRDLGWASVNYVCVRDELGNRWFANIRVPDGNVRLDRTVYMAQIQVSEVTSTPTPISEVPS